VTIFADASALIAIITGDAEALALADCLEAEPRRICSAMSVWETVAGLCRSYTFSVPSARARVRLFLDTLEFAFVDIGEREFEIAAEAYAQFGRGRHQADLNMGDCFAYACARAG
jgi:ribonuclease VapC